MKPNVVEFKKPVRIFQVFRNINEYGKEDKSFEDRKEKFAWKPMISTSGYVKDHELFLPASMTSKPNFGEADLITLLDDNLPPIQSILLTHEKNHCFKLSSMSKLDIFQLKLKEEIELHLRYGYFEVGLPSRKDFKLCEVKVGHPVEIKINGKTESSLSSRRARVFKDQVYIFEYLGDFKQCTLLEQPIITKHIPEQLKVVDLNKRLW